jgi:hypothetical protein
MEYRYLAGKQGATIRLLIATTLEGSVVICTSPGPVTVKVAVAVGLH